MDENIIFIKLLVNRLAVIWGIVSRDITKTIPTICRQATIVKAINSISVYSKKCTGSPCDNENSLSKEIDIIGCINKEKKAISATDRVPSMIKSTWLIVKMFPNK